MNLLTNILPYWLIPAVVLTPALLWLFLGVGLPYALALLPRRDWRHRTMVIAVSMALGPALTTTGLFLLGTFGQFSLIGALVVSLIVFLIGVALFRFNRRTGDPSDVVINYQRLNTIEITLIVVIVIGLIIRFWNTAYWPYTTYDEFWVYGYNAKIFMLRGAIPQSMGYYPQLVPLSYTFMQLMWSGVNDHAARTVVPMFALASILMAYLLGAKLFNRRVGLLTAAIWALYPQQTAWSQFGDLEVPTTLYFTATVLFFALGWREKNPRYIILSGLMMGAALWTKPTAAALVESFALFIGVSLISWVLSKRDSLTAWLRSNQFVLPMLALCVAAPIGGMWYIRNVLYGHPPLVLPAAYWQVAAQRSGQELGWPLLIAACLTLLLIIRREQVRFAVLGLALLLVGSLPSAFAYRLPTFDEVSQLIIGNLPSSLAPKHLGIVEYAILAVGAVLLISASRNWWRTLSTERRDTLLILGAFIVPYFATWFWSYSYHPRLSFAIVPSLIVLVAALLDRLLVYASSSIKRRAQGPMLIRFYKFAAIIVIVVLALPAWWAGSTALVPALSNQYPDDHARYAAGNPALMKMVDYLHNRRDPHRRPAVVNRPLRIAAPGELRLPFFFPNDDIRVTDYPIMLDQIAHVDYFMDSSVGQRLYNEHGLGYNQILSSFNRFEVMFRIYDVDDKNFRFALYYLNNKLRFVEPQPMNPILAKLGDFAELVGFDTGRLEGSPGQPFLLTLSWKAIKPGTLDYSVFIHWWDPRTNQLVASWGGEPVSGAWSVWYNVAGAHFSQAYHTRLWQTGERVMDEWMLVIPDAPAGVYELRVGLYDPISGERLPVRINGKPDGEWARLRDFTILGGK
jgi:4-amino-4-deoxy-L-arabinose transferase-like glycosyltransferase